MKRSYIIILSIAVLFLLSCESKEDKIVEKDIKLLTQDSNSSQITDDRIKNENEEINKDNRTIINRMGVSSKDGVITIDTNKAKSYIKDVGDNIKDKSKELSNDIKNNTLHVTKSIGIEVNNSTLSIDFNKTKHFMKDMGGKVVEFTKDVKELASEFKENK